MKTIDGYGTQYSVDVSGNVYSHFSHNARKLKPILCSDGYLRVNLRDQFRKRKMLGIHRIVALAFIDGHKDGLVVNHKNGVKTDNSVENLEWVTRLENARHAARCGFLKHPLSKKEIALEAARMRAEGKKFREISEHFGVSHATAYKWATSSRAESV